MKVQDVMTEIVRTCSPDMNLAEATSIMWEADCGTLPVVADGGKVIAMITDRDIAIASGTKNRLASDTPVSEAMSQTVYYCTPEEDIHSALKTMRREKVRRLPVVNSNGVIEGVVSMNDVALHAEKFDGHKTTALSYDDVVSTLKAICEHRHPKAAKESRVATP